VNIVFSDVLRPAAGDPVASGAVDKQAATRRACPTLPRASFLASVDASAAALPSTSRWRLRRPAEVGLPAGSCRRQSVVGFRLQGSSSHGINQAVYMLLACGCRDAILRLRFCRCCW
jgi:hypothetical protein